MSKPKQPQEKIIWPTSGGGGDGRTSPAMGVTPAMRAQVARLEDSIAYLTGLTQLLERKVKEIETRLALLESRVTQPVGGLKR